MWHRLRSPVQRVAYYTVSIGREAVPRRLWRRWWAKRLAGIEAGPLDPEIAERVAYYNKLWPGAAVGEAPPLDAMARRPSYYYYDLRQFALAFAPHLRFAHVFGDVTTVPPVPAIVKSRPVDGANENSVLMKLDRLRHFRWPRDGGAFIDKKPAAVWRGVMNNAARKRLVALYGNDPRFDIGHVGAVFESTMAKPRLTVREQLAYRYVISLEGHDVATNLKWIMASNSLCMMPRPRYETWFMEGRLEPGVHYAELRDDLGDLPEKVEHFERHPDEARRIIAAAHAHVARFSDRKREELISLLVLQKYFECTGQIDPGFASANLCR
ncbi:glycosyl transferase family 90 [Nitratireductor sp. ZSWI3]|uniref:glycosyl transferase family 90 n=1 Tax=Nitratireductor sp. ZSWI3 TaxID=2966359 RepID=UPI00215051BF|nr:glycosyl transferase family 90 [Nitratireductor sp. ZSWI3]MCR4265102.1 glycosyl transferase family 90 [Nitratireductor sp. ZSWI3]